MSLWSDAREHTGHGGPRRRSLDALARRGRARGETRRKLNPPVGWGGVLDLLAASIVDHIRLVVVHGARTEQSGDEGSRLGADREEREQAYKG